MNNPLKVEPYWMSLKRLIETRMDAIVRKEHGNIKYIHLYSAGEYWHAFEESAFQLSLIFEEYETVLFRHKNYPFPVIMASIAYGELQTYTRQHIPVSNKPDYTKLLVSELSTADYYSWHKRTVKEFL